MLKWWIGISLVFAFFMDADKGITSTSIEAARSLLWPWAFAYVIGHQGK